MMTRLGSSSVGGNQNLLLWVSLQERHHHFHVSFTTSGSSNSSLDLVEEPALVARDRQEHPRVALDVLDLLGALLGGGGTT